MPYTQGERPPRYDLDVKRLTATCLIAAGDELGECPVWDPSADELLWTDIHGKRLHRLPDRSTAPITIDLDKRLCSFAVTDSGLLIAAFDTGLALLDRSTGDYEWLGDVEADRPETRCNDGRPDRNGNFVFGTMVEGKPEPGTPAGSFYHWNAGRGLTHLYRTARIPNGLCFGADGLVIHYADSIKGTIWRARYHPQHALLIEDEVFIGPDDQPGAPDGAAVDVDGNVWNARWGASGVACYAPNGEMIAFVDLDVPNVTACTFGGPLLDRLYITTAREGLRSTDPVHERSGSLYVVDPETTGLAAVPVATGRPAQQAIRPMTS